MTREDWDKLTPDEQWDKMVECGNIAFESIAGWGNLIVRTHNWNIPPFQGSDSAELSALYDALKAEAKRRNEDVK